MLRTSAPLIGALERMKNIQVVDGADNCLYDIFTATDDEFALIFPPGQDVAFIEEVLARECQNDVNEALTKIWKRRVAKRDAIGIDGLLYFELHSKAQYYPSRRDEEATNPDGSSPRDNAL